MEGMFTLVIRNVLTFSVRVLVGLTTDVAVARDPVGFSVRGLSSRDYFGAATIALSNVRRRASRTVVTHRSERLLINRLRVRDARIGVRRIVRRVRVDADLVVPKDLQLMNSNLVSALVVLLNVHGVVVPSRYLVAVNVRFNL